MKYVPVDVSKRVGKSHLRPIKDGIRFLLIIFRIATLFSPLKLFLPVSLAFFACASGWSFASSSRATRVVAPPVGGATPVRSLGSRLDDYEFTPD